MSLDLLIPFAILFIMVIYFIYTRNKFEKNLEKMYEEKFEKWKKNSKIEQKEKSCKELVALVYKKDYKLDIELLDNSISQTLKKGKFTVKEK